MKKKNLEAGIAPLIIILIVALVIVVGGGVYLGTRHAAEAPTDASVQADADVSADENGSLRDLFALGKNVMCTFNNADASGTNSGTVYISGNMMRGDFSMQSQSNAAMESHMIRNGDIMYAWTGNQGAKMTFTNVQPNPSATAETKEQANLDKKLDYKCTGWSPDSSKFNVPSAVNFMDVTAAMNANANAGGASAGAAASAQCGACASLQGTSKTQCLAALHC